MTEQTTNVDAVLSALLDTDYTPEKDVYMKRFGVNFRIKAIDNRTLSRIRQRATINKKGDTDRDKFFALVVVSGCISPDWKAPELKKFGSTTEDIVQERLLPGELAKLAEEILLLSGFGDEEEEIEEIKN